MSPGQPHNMHCEAQLTPPIPQASPLLSHVWNSVCGPIHDQRTYRIEPTENAHRPNISTNSNPMMSPAPSGTYVCNDAITASQRSISHTLTDRLHVKGVCPSCNNRDRALLKALHRHPPRPHGPGHPHPRVHSTLITECVGPHNASRACTPSMIPP